MNYLSLCRSIGRNVQKEIDKAYGNKKWIKEIGEGAGGDRTMRADKLAEDITIKGLKRLKDFYLVSEEFGERQFGSGGPTVVVDPIDGSKNFKRGIGHFALSIGLASGKTLEDMSFGYIRDLSLDNEYWALKGKGAFRNGKRIRTSSRKDIEILGIEFSKGPLNINALPLLGSIRSARALGSIAVSMSFFSEGLIDAYAIVKGESRVLDCAAGYLIAKEAGGIIKDFRLNDLADVPLSLRSRLSFFCCANGDVFRKTVSVLRNK